MVSSTEGNLVQNIKVWVWLATMYFTFYVLYYILYVAYFLYDDMHNLS